MHLLPGEKKIWAKSTNTDFHWQSIDGNGNVHKQKCTEALNQGLKFTVFNFLFCFSDPNCMKSIHLMKTKMENDFCAMENDFCVADATRVADVTTGYNMVALPIILNHIEFIPFAANHGALAQQCGN